MTELYLACIDKLLDAAFGAYAWEKKSQRASEKDILSGGWEKWIHCIPLYKAVRRIT